jgi:hypothetical protein
MGGGGATSCDDSMGRYVDLENCHCQAQLDLLCKFHHLDADIVYGDHKAEEIHHCNRPYDAKGEEYKIIHCGCPPAIECQKCLQADKRACMARKTHAISLKVVTASLHIDFVSVERFIKEAQILLEFFKRCPKNSGYWHMQTADFGCSASLRVQREKWCVKGEFKTIDSLFIGSENKIRDLEHELFDAKQKNKDLLEKINKIRKSLD